MVDVLEQRSTSVVVFPEDDKTLFLDEVLQDAYKQNPGLKSFQEGQLEDVLDRAYGMMEEFNKASLRPKEHLPKTKEEAEKIIGIIVLPGPGTYLNSTKHKEKTMLSHPWMADMDHRRVEYAAWLVRQITERKSGERLIGNPTKMREVIDKTGPYLIYNGAPEENAAIRDALQRDYIYFPKSKVFIIDADVGNTVGNIKHLKLPEIENTVDKKILLVTHAPHAVRALFILEHFKEVLEGAELQVFPIPVPKQGLMQFMKQELQGILYYAFIKNEAARTPHQYQL